MTYEELLVNYEGIVKVKEDNFSKVHYLNGLSGLYKNGKIAINSNLKSDIHKKCVLAEELGHHFTTSGNILNQDNVTNIKKEKIARNWGYEKLVSIKNILDAFNNGARNKFEMAEYLEVTEAFLEDALSHYKEKYGIMLKLDNYTVYFEPHFGVLKMF
ncbi:ImmA/IrrE family metallo-endopeptidase [Clostridium paridis]|uniref:ImmA/IrrE family metallo-endopeptidase n=1 Tax=Clostridium paridis TaxID=2803863 RepID=A0A937K583_9CLOT|nr:ImmA/IrrE family metallo-endopeptidase [Clostridium paridis]MBL4932293.1 ImmA/IrrE family metallo-endopeptidase [Clostridium paridis]